MKKEIDKNEAAEKFFEEPSEEQMQQEFQEILKKREEYQRQQEEELCVAHKDEKEKKRRRRSTLSKVAVVVLIAGTCLSVFSIHSEATRMWWLQAMERVIGGESENIVNNDENRVLSDMKEKQALAEIEEKTGIPMPELIYKPTGMVFDGYEYGEVNSWGTLYYLYENNVIMINALSAENDATYAWSYAGEILSEEVVQTAYGSVTVREVREKNDEKASYLAQWTYHNHQYLIEGKLSFEEMKKIIENILF